MDNPGISDEYLQVLDELQHAVILLSRRDEVIWSNSTARSVFDLEQVQRVLARHEQLSRAYDDGGASYVFALPTQLGFPVSFSLVIWSDVQVLISTPLSKTDLHGVRSSLLRMLERNLKGRADAVVDTASRLRCRLLNGRISSRDELMRQLEQLCAQGRELQVRWQEVSELLGSIESGLDRVDRVDIRQMTELAVSGRNGHKPNMHVSYYNSEYGVIYGDMGLFVDTLTELLRSSLEDEAGDRDVTLNVYQSTGAVVWQWMAFNEGAQFGVRPSLLWEFLGGEFARREKELGVVFSLRMGCGGAARTTDRDLALWSENVLSDYWG